MIRRTATCPNCGERMLEEEDDWYLCRSCDKDYTHEEIEETLAKK